MSYQSESQLENQLLTRMSSISHEYEKVTIRDEKELEENFRIQLNKLNENKLEDIPLTDKEFERVMIYLKGKSVFQTAKQIRDKFELQRDNGETVFISFIDFDNLNRNTFQVTNQVTMKRTYENRYDVTVLINGLPIVQIELKRRGKPIKEAFNQFCRYARHTFDGLYRCLQILVISNGVDTKYMANSDKPFQYSLTFFWTDEDNHRLTNLQDFTDSFLNKKHLLDMLNTYMVLNDSDKVMMIMRPYQVFASKAAIKMATETANNCFVWACTGSGKTLTSFKVAQVSAEDPRIKKVIFLIDRNDLDTQTIEEFNKFEANSVDTTDNTYTLVKQLKDENTRLIVTTIQKLNNAVKNERYEKVLEPYKNQKVIFIVDECHRSTFGEMSTRIRKFFTKSQFIGFTGTPRFKENKSQDGRTTADIFGRCVHTYLTKDAIFDNNVLGFSVEYIKTFDGQYDEDDDEKVKGIDKNEVYESDERVSIVANHIIQNHNIKTLQRKYTGIFATSSIQMLNKYYKEFKNIKHNLNVAAIYSFQANEDMEGKSEHSRESLDEIIKDYNKTFGTSFNSETFGAYHSDVSKKVKSGQIDILIVVNMFLTGFDSKPLNTLYVDKNLKYHDLLQAFSRTNRVFDATKIWGNVVCYRNLKEETDQAIKLFSKTDNVNDVLYKDYGTYLNDFKIALGKMLKIAPNPSSIDTMHDEKDQKAFIIQFKALTQTLLALRTFTDFEFEEDTIGINEQNYEDYKSKYLMIYEKYKKETEGTKASILDDIEFGIELIQTDRINVSYIMNLIRNIERNDEKQRDKDVKHIIKELDRSDNPQLRKKSELIKNFLLKELPHVNPEEDIDSAYNSYENETRNNEIKEFANNNDLDEQFVRGEISEFEFTGNIDREKILNNIKKPFLLKKKLTALIIDFIQENVFKY